MKYKNLLIKAHNFKKELSEDYSNLRELLKNNPSYIEISRVCLGENIENFIFNSGIDKKIYKNALKDKEIPNNSLGSLFLYINKKFRENNIKKDDLIQNFSRNWVCIDNIDKCEKWAKYDQKYNFYTQYIPLLLMVGYVLLFLIYNFLNKADKTDLDIFLGIIFSLILLFLIIYGLIANLKGSPRVFGLKFFIISVLLENDPINNMNIAKKYIIHVSRLIRLKKGELERYFSIPYWGVAEFYDELGKKIQEHIFPHIGEGNLDSIIEIFDTLGRLSIDPSPANLSELKKYTKYIENNFSAHPFTSPTIFEIVKSNLEVFGSLKEYLLNFGYILGGALFIFLISIIIDFLSSKFYKELPFIGIFGAVTVIYAAHLARRR